MPAKTIRFEQPCLCWTISCGYGFTESALRSLGYWLKTEAFPDVRRRFRIIARHYRELTDRELQADKARMAELIERARHQRQRAAAKGTLPAKSDTQFFLIAAE
jgi:hypothetical protein